MSHLSRTKPIHAVMDSARTSYGMQLHKGRHVGSNYFHSEHGHHICRHIRYGIINVRCRFSSWGEFHTSPSCCCSMQKINPRLDKACVMHWWRRSQRWQHLCITDTEPPHLWHNHRYCFFFFAFATRFCFFRPRSCFHWCHCHRRCRSQSLDVCLEYRYGVWFRSNVVWIDRCSICSFCAN